MHPDREISRRRLLGALAAGGGAVLLGCSSSPDRPAPRAAASSPAAPRPGSTPPSSPPSVSAGTGAASAESAAARLPSPSPWRPSPYDVRPAVKRRAVDVVVAVGAWPAGGAGRSAARARLARLGADPALADQAGPLLTGDPQAVVQVVDVQYGGILPAAASVLVVVRQWRRHATGAVVATGTTVDVRLRAAAPRWQVTALHPARPGAPAAHLPTPAAQVLASPRIHLPVAARADVRSGAVSAATLRALLGLARRHVVDVSVLRSGHPLHVFGTGRLSDHPRGHAVDVWAIDGHPVVDRANRRLVERFMREAVAFGPWQVGGPVDLDGSGGQYFSDLTHQDHVHLGFHG